MSEELKAEVLRRRDLALANPPLLEPWDGTVERLRARLNPPPPGYGATGDFRVIVSPAVHRMGKTTEVQKWLFDFHDAPLRRPDRFAPDPDFLKWHREHRYRNAAQLAKFGIRYNPASAKIDCAVVSVAFATAHTSSSVASSIPAS